MATIAAALSSMGVTRGDIVAGLSESPLLPWQDYPSPCRLSAQLSPSPGGYAGHCQSGSHMDLHLSRLWSHCESRCALDMVTECLSADTGGTEQAVPGQT